MKGIMKDYERLPPIMKGYERCSKMLRIWRENSTGVVDRSRSVMVDIDG